MTNLHDPRDMDVFDQDATEPADLPPADMAADQTESSMEQAGETACLDPDRRRPPATPTGRELEASAWSDSPPLEPDMAAVQVFWEEARKVAGLTVLNVVIGENPLGLIPPPVWQFQGPDNTARFSTRLAQMVADGSKTATASAAWEYEDAHEATPQSGDLSIICDGAGRPVALVVTSDVKEVPFDQVDEDFAKAEGEDDQRLETWRLAHVRLLKQYQDRNADAPWPPDQPWPTDMMVLESLKCLYPKPRGKHRQLFS